MGMLSYRHAFHAGNAADILKHSVLLFCLDYLGQKDTPYLCIDTHAGAGFYSLDSGYALQNREWERGIGRLAGFTRDHSGGETASASPGPLERLTALARDFRPCPADSGLYYPGSPALIRALLRPRDRAVCFELHPADFAILKQTLGTDRRFSLRREDGFAGLKSLLPPPSRRACVFIDPPYEIKEDYENLPHSLAGALKRFPTGLYIIWYPLLGNKDAALPETLFGLHRGNRCRAELRTASRTDRGMYGSGLVILNPPWTLKAALESALPVMADLLGEDRHEWDLRWESPSRGRGI
ncbi:MAG: 23S rRNA (adenine(2030)-N(6))-methyltransferase RlmJ [Treponema sp.]|jgi:23S rRNA (adenine2030-N6)-methyltransferase|nr:23S rRNA (adenine(2030)-N(6))-methyltransferase RlmJ [Treponema sp.]